MADKDRAKELLAMFLYESGEFAMRSVARLGSESGRELSEPEKRIVEATKYYVMFFSRHFVEMIVENRELLIDLLKIDGDGGD